MEKSCSHCGKPVDSHGAKGYCATCYQRYRRNGTADKRAPKNCSHCNEPVGRKGAKGYCGKCYMRWKRHGDPAISLINREHGETCLECSEPPIAQGYCTMHYQRWAKHGDPSTALPGGREGCRKYTLHHEYFDDIATQEQAYWLGFITADGGIIRSGRTFALRMMLAERDAAHVQRLADALGSDKPPQTRRGSTSVSFDSWRLVESLGRLGVTPRKSATVEPWNGPARLMPHYWRGLFDGDGWIGISRGTWRLGICGSAPCVLGYAAWGSGICGSKARLHQHRTTPTCWYWTVGGNRMARRLAEALYDGATVTLPRKQERAERLMSL